ncbi:hypothetical protein J7I94_19135 [Streptomyces sp. ISL-12]|uniref:hypothetical protein n=1 Tax=Streptomyces sp. ISL-12 TaxID=2819177 RepID=UPI001BE91B60|nr:hypothetical protein [Streptomyces sp. ISL-12]MBT2412649.1 hypothetical protein [Streptomyces sp. ISL-12]
MPTSPGPLLTAVDALWEQLRTDVPELPAIRPVVSPLARTHEHGPERWTRDDDGVVSGLVITADVLQQGATATLETILHDAAHILCWVRGVQDVTMRGAYHNQTYLAAAEEVGLTWPEGVTRSTQRGFRDVVIKVVTKARLEQHLQSLEDAIPLVLPHLTLPSSSSATKRTARLTYLCACDPPRTFRISRTVAAQGAITCGVCGQEFSAQ